jgi:hypothetical protein
MTAPHRAPAGPARADHDPAVAWQEYLAATRRLDAVRRGAATAAGEQAQTVQVARQQLTAVRARLAPQQSRLRKLGVPELALTPTHPEVAAAARALAGGPEAVLAALRQARSTADTVDATLAGTRLPGPLAGLAGAPRWLHNLLFLYAPLALALLAAVVCLGAGIFMIVR